ncbi:hypothetical protein FKP32DRAFT_1607597 [Trametes sanguinea]|nr:hypothetical protein FKP32DRAFT_1607597 [Trametes sanguinea]
MHTEEAEGLWCGRTEREIANGNPEGDALEELVHIEETACYDCVPALSLPRGRDPSPRPAQLKSRLEGASEVASDVSEQYRYLGSSLMGPGTSTGKGKGVERMPDNPMKETPDSARTPVGAPIRANTTQRRLMNTATEKEDVEDSSWHSALGRRLSRHNKLRPVEYQAIELAEEQNLKASPTYHRMLANATLGDAVRTVAKSRPEFDDNLTCPTPSEDMEHLPGEGDSDEGTPATRPSTPEVLAAPMSVDTKVHLWRNTIERAMEGLVAPSLATESWEVPRQASGGGTTSSVSAVYDSKVETALAEEIALKPAALSKASSKSSRGSTSPHPQEAASPIANIRAPRAAIPPARELWEGSSQISEVHSGLGPVRYSEPAPLPYASVQVSAAEKASPTYSPAPSTAPSREAEPMAITRVPASPRPKLQPPTIVAARAPPLPRLWSPSAAPSREVSSMAVAHASPSSPRLSLGPRDNSTIAEHRIPDLPSEPLRLYRVPSPAVRSAVICYICRETISGAIIRLRCQHTFDTACIRELYSKATTDESAFPPKCCGGPLDFQHLEPYLDEALKATYKQKAYEFSIPNRVYCSNARCAAFLGVAFSGPFAVELPCSRCASSTCARCKERAHPGKECHLYSDEKVLELGKEQGWQRCATNNSVTAVAQYGRRADANCSTCRPRYRARQVLPPQRRWLARGLTQVLRYPSSSLAYWS